MMPAPICFRYRKQMPRFRAPGSSANLGPGFDCLALALDTWCEVSVEPAAQLTITNSGPGAPAGPPPATDHLAAQVVRRVLGHDRVHIEIASDIPPARGLGSSAALAVAAAAAAGAEDPFAVAVEFEGHPENAAASTFGGLVAATVTPAGPAWRPLPYDPDLRCVLIVPRRPLSTAHARAALETTVARDAAVANLGRLSLLIAGFADLDRWHPAAMDDFLHQSARTELFPQAPALLAALVNAGALGAAWSGAGPTLIGVCRAGDAREVAEATRVAVERLLSDSDVVLVRPVSQGVTAVRSAPMDA